MKKIPTIYKRNPDNPKKLTDEVQEGCQWVFDGEGVATRKYDGTCCRIKDKKLFKRREIKRDKEAPKNFIEETHDKITGKKTGWVECDVADNSDTYHFQAFNNMEDGKKCDGTYELLGPKIQGNPEGYREYTLLKHSDAEEIEIKFDKKSILTFLESTKYEGIVFHHPDGRMAKIKKRDFGY